jgi:hypothetical protein
MYAAKKQGQKINQGKTSLKIELLYSQVAKGSD